MAPQASKKCGLLPPDHQQIGYCTSNGHRFGKGFWHLFRTHDLIALPTGISTKREKVPDAISQPRNSSVVAKKRKSMVCSFIFISLISLPYVIPSGVLGAGGNCPDRKELSITREKQRTVSWCWAAAAKIAMHYRGGTQEQCFVVDAVRQNQLGIYSPSSCCIANPNISGCGDILDYSWAALNEFGFGYDSLGESEFGWPQLREQICDDGPIVYGEDYKHGGGHEYVIYGFIEDKTIYEKMVIFYDPLDDLNEYHEEPYDTWLRLQPGANEIRSSVQFLINIKKQ